MKGRDAKQSGSYFKEKAAIGLSTFTGDEITKAIMKTTSHLLKAPKEKYMQKLIAASYGQYGFAMKEGIQMNEFIVRELEKRAHTYNWIVVLKTMVSFHRLMSDASDDMVETICHSRRVFNTSYIKNLADRGDGIVQESFIMQYMPYLEERCVMQAAIGKGLRIEIAEFDEYLETLNADSLQPVFCALLRLLEAVSAVRYSELAVDNFCTMEAYQLLVRDGKRLFQVLAKRIIFILDGFEELILSQKRIWLDLYKRYNNAFAALKALFDAILLSSRVFVEPIPRLKPLPESLLARLELNVRSAARPTEEVCTLEDLGIRSTEDPRVDHEEEKLLARRGGKSAVAEIPQTVTSRTEAATTFSMDDLFVSSPAPAVPSPGAASAATWPFPSPALPTVPPAIAQEQWCCGAPAGWSSGAPEDTHPASPATFGGSSAQSPMPQPSPLFSGTSQVTQSVPVPQTLSGTGHAGVSRNSGDPFKDLYLRSQLDFN